MTVTAGTTYVASYHTNGGHYAATMNGLANSGDQRAADRGRQRRGVRATDPAPCSRTTPFNASNYWVDAVYQPDNSPLTVTATTPSDQATSVPVGTSVTATFNKAIQSGSATFTLTDSRRKRRGREARRWTVPARC